jgi:tetratricopeptide (TPR) repeat protein
MLVRPHAFVAMPFGRKPGPDGTTEVDFNAIWKLLLKPALEHAGFEAFRADEEQRAGDIRVDMFQELLAADMVLVDLTVPNPNVWYELGVRHALRERGVVLVYGAMPGVEAPKVFDVYTDRKLRYALAADGSLDAATLKTSLAALTAMIAETRHSSTRRKVSPVYQLLPHLRAPEWRSLLMNSDNELSQTYAAWLNALNTARRKMRAGDVMTLADETPVRALALEGLTAAGNALLALQQPALALEKFNEALSIDADNLGARQKRLVCLGRIDRLEEARGEAETLTRTHGDDAESWALMGRLEKMRWVRSWCPDDVWPTARNPQPDIPRLRAAAADELALLELAIAPYQQGFLADPRSHYAGINALTLMHLYRHLAATTHATDDGEDGPVTPVALQALQGGVHYAVESSLSRHPTDYWSLATKAELALLHDAPATVRKRWQRAVPLADHDWFALDASRQTVTLMAILGFRPEATAEALAVLERELGHARRPDDPPRVFLFTGHMMDRPDRPQPRLPPQLGGAAAQRIAEQLDRWQAGRGDIAYCQAAAGGDLFFLEACLRRGVECRVLLPFDEPSFVQKSIEPSLDMPGEPSWRERWLAARSQLASPPRIMTVELGPSRRDIDPYERCNLWLLNNALAHGPDRLHFMALWNGEPGDGPGGTAHLKSEAERRTTQVAWIDTRDLARQP